MLNNKNKTKYKMIDYDGSIHYEESPRYKQSDFIRQLKYIKEYFFVEPYDKKNGKNISFKYKNKMQNALILRITSSGDKNDLENKRIQIKKSDISRKKKPDFVIAIYEFKNNILYASINDFFDFQFSSNNSTTLTWIKFSQLKKATKNGFDISPPKKRKKTKKVYKIFIYKNLEKLLENLDKDKNYIPNEWSWLDEFQFEKKENFEKITQKIKNYNLSNFQEDVQIGRIGEEYFYNLCKKESLIIKKIFPNFHFENLKWLNKEKEKFLPWDFEYNDIFIELKSSKTKDFFFLSKNEKNKMNESSSYILIKLNNYDFKTKKFDEPIFYNKDALLKMNNEIFIYLFKEKKEKEYD